KRAAKGLRIGGVDEVMGRRARCCNPVPGDDVVGFVTRGRGVAIHRRSCANILSTREPERLVDIDWGTDGDDTHAVDVEIRATDHAGLMGELTRLVTAIGVNINSARAESSRGRSAFLRFSLDCRSADQVAQVIARIDRHPDVLEVRRVGRR
ncbi:MAG: (p)ppGpp synthetase, partial [Gemmatimonadetes bacterium]|nr:(p)ppGpp synthetase [Gemmatimonadota bacterium]